jgi:hypothetical protein
MPRKPVGLDTNAVIHYIAVEDVVCFDKVSRLLIETDCFVPMEVISEAAFVLENVIGMERQIISDKMKDFITLQDNLVPGTDPNPEILIPRFRDDRPGLDVLLRRFFEFRFRKCSRHQDIYLRLLSPDQYESPFRTPVATEVSPGQRKGVRDDPHRKGFFSRSLHRGYRSCQKKTQGGPFFGEAGGGGQFL